MNLDVKTMVSIIILTRIIQIFIFGHQLMTSKEQKDVKYWLMWSIFETLAFSVMFLRNIDHIFKFTVIFQNTMLLLASISLFSGTLFYFNLRLKKKAVVYSTIIYILLLIIFSFFQDDVQIRAFVTNTGLLIYYVLNGIILLQNARQGKKNLQLLLSLIFFIYSGVLLMRIFTVLFVSYDLTNMFDSHPVNTLTIISLISLSIIWTYGYVILVNQNITKQLRESMSRFELLFNTSPDAVSLTRIRDGLIRNANDNFYELFGINHDVIGKSTSDLNIWKDPQDRKKIMGVIEKSGGCHNVEVELQKGTESFKGLFSAKKISFENEDHIIAVSRDISDYRNAQQEAVEAGRKWQLTFNSLPEAIFILDNEGIVQNLNSSSAGLLNRKIEEMKGRHCWELIHGSEGHIDHCPFVRMKDSRMRESMILPVNEKWFEITTDPTFNSRRELTGAVHIMSDITDRKTAEDNLNRKAAELKQTNDLMIGREIKMKELKQEINELLKECGKEPKY